MIKFYFGYNKFNGNIFPVKWMEEDGKPVGGKPSQILWKVEIIEKEFLEVNFVKLQVTYPFYSDYAEPKTKV